MSIRITNLSTTSRTVNPHKTAGDKYYQPVPITLPSHFALYSVLIKTAEQVSTNFLNLKAERQQYGTIIASEYLRHNSHRSIYWLGLTDKMASPVNNRKGPLAPAPEAPMALDPANGKKAQQQSEEDIPPLTHIIPTIFVPLTENLLEPIEPAKDRVERMERMVASLDAHEKKVRSNIAWTYEREARRHVAEVKRSGALSTPHEPELMRWEEAERHIANMSAPANPSMAYHLPPEKIAEFKAYDQSRADLSLPDGLGPHERTSQEVLIIANRGVRDMEAYSNNHIKGIRDRLKASLEKEKRAVASFDKPRA